MKGDSVYVMFTQVFDNGSTVRETVQTFEEEQTAKEALNLFAVEQDEWIKKNHPEWKREQGSETFYEAYDEDSYYKSHALGKIVMNVVE